MQVNPYLNFNGNCEAAFQFYERSLGGKIECLVLHEGTPAEAHTPAEWRKKVLHGRLNLNGQVIMASDCPPEHYQKPQGFSVTLGVKEPGDAEKYFHALAENGKVSMPIQETFWAHRFGMVVDQFGIPWMINCEKAMQIQPQDVETSQAVAS
jgi:PhnB protein